MRVSQDILNPWGRAGGVDPQRSDLWQVDLSAAVTGLNTVLFGTTQLANVPRYFLQSITLPELKVRPEVIRRDSRSYNMPSWDEPLDAIRMVFVVDDAAPSDDASTSLIYQVLDSWRAVVRAGRGAVGNEVPVVSLDANYRIDYAFDVYVYLLRGVMPQVPSAGSRISQSPPAASDPSQAQTFGDSGGDPATTATQAAPVPSMAAPPISVGTFDVSGILHLEKAWLSSFKVNDLAYERTGILTIDASFYADNLLQV